MRRVSPKTAKRDRLYAKARVVYLEMHPHCEIGWDLNCTMGATEVHHMAGRYPSVFFRTDLWKAVCHHCHQQATDNSGEAIERGFSVHRHEVGL